jgi:hypothetical protein
MLSVSVPPKFVVILFSGAMLAVFFGLIWYFIRRSKRDRLRNGFAAAGESSGGGNIVASGRTSNEAEQVEAPFTASNLESSMSFAVRLRREARSWAEPETRSMLEDIAARVCEFETRLDDSTPFDFVEELVDRVDDLKQIRTRRGGHDIAPIDRFLAILESVLGDCDVKLLHSETWDPSIQRAISKVPTEGLIQPPY